MEGGCQIGAICIMKRNIDNKIIDIIMTGLNGGMKDIDADSIYDRLEIRGNKISPTYFRERLKEMVNKGLLIRIGEKPGQHNPKPYRYALPDNILEEAR